MTRPGHQLGQAGFTHQRGSDGGSMIDSWASWLGTLMALVRAPQGPPPTHPYIPPFTHTHTHPNIHTFVSQKCVILHFFPTKAVHERSDFLRVTQPFNTSSSTNVRRRGNLHATFKQRAREKHSWGRLKPKQRKEEEIHLFSKGGNIRRPLLPCVLAGRAEPLDYVMLTEQANDG